MIDPLEALEKEETKPVYQDPLESLETGKVLLKPGHLVQFVQGTFDHMVMRVLDVYTTGEGKIPMAHCQVIDVPTAHIWGQHRDFKIKGE